MSELEEYLNQVALEKKAAETKNSIVKRAMEKEATLAGAGGIIGAGYRALAKGTQAAGKAIGGKKGGQEALKNLGATRRFIKKNPVKTAVGVGGAAYLAKGSGNKNTKVNVYNQSRVKND